MNKSDPSRERSSALRRSRVARQGLVLGAVAGSLGIAGALGLSAAVNQATPPSSGTTNTSQGNTSQGNPGGGSTPTQVRIYQGGDDGGEHESDDGGSWVPARPSPTFNTGGASNGGTSNGGTSTGNSSGGSGSGGSASGGSAPAPAPAPQATTGGS